MPRLKVRNICYMLVATVCLLLYYNALVPSKDYDKDQDAELVDKWIEKKLDAVVEKDRDKDGVQKKDENGANPIGDGQKQAPQAKPDAPKEREKKEAVKNSSKDSKPQKPSGKEKEYKKTSDDKKIAKKTGNVKSKDTSKVSKEAWMAEMAKIQKQRKSHLRQVCNKQMKRPLKTMDDLGSNPKQLRPLIVNDKHHFIYSIVYKAGSTNWERVIVEDLEGFKNVPNQKLFSHRALRWMPGFSPEDAKQRLKNYTKFIFVRNPLSRILSAYKDKFVDHHNSVFSKIAKNIIKMYRKGPIDESAIDVSFPEFMEYLVNKSEHRTNVHWKVIFNQNFPCELDYDIIGKLEEADNDIPYVLERIGIRNLTKYGSTSMKKKGSDEKLWAEYYSQVPENIMKKFYEVYRPDFVLYGYDMPTLFKKP